MTYKRWDVVAVHIPFLEGADSKRRPALIISADKFHSEHALYWIAMITTAKSGARSKDVTVSDRERAGLPEPCVVRVPRIATVSDQQIAKKLGGLAPKDRNAVSALLKRYLP